MRWAAGGAAVLATATAVTLAVVSCAPLAGSTVPIGPSGSTTDSPSAETTPSPLNASPTPGGTTGFPAERTGIVVNPQATNAPHKVVVYVDYRCPSCRAFEDAYGAALEGAARDGSVLLEYRPVAILDRQGQDGSLRAAIAAACADAAGVFLSYQRELFANQSTNASGLTNVQLRTDLARAAGITGGLASFRTCYNQRETEQFVRRLTNTALKAGLTGVPTIEVDGGHMTTDYEVPINVALGTGVEPTLAPSPSDNPSPVSSAR